MFNVESILICVGMSVTMLGVLAVLLGLDTLKERFISRMIQKEGKHFRV